MSLSILAIYNANEVVQIKEIPKSPSGKILRRVLRDKEKKGEFGLVVKDEARAKL